MLYSFIRTFLSYLRNAIYSNIVRRYRPHFISRMFLSAVKSSTAQTVYAFPDSSPPADNSAVLSRSDVRNPVHRTADGSLLQFTEPDVFNAPNPDGNRELRNPMPSLPLLPHRRGLHRSAG